MKYQNAKLPEKAVLAGTTPVMNEKTVLKPILSGHMAPKGKYGLLKVLEGKLQFVWEDTKEVLDADPKYSIVIEPERLHHVALCGPVKFKVEFYTAGASCCCGMDSQAVRPGEAFCKGKKDEKRD